VGAYFRQKLEELQAKHAIIGDVRAWADAALELVENARPRSRPPPAPTH